MCKLLLKNRYISFGLLFALNIIFLICILQFIPLLFDSTDDVAMCYIANGHLFGIPEPRLVFINAIYGEVLCFLYSKMPTIEWYSVSFLILQIIAFSTIEYFILKSIKNTYVKTLLLLSCIIMWWRFLVGFQFTTTAGVLCLAGCILLLAKNKDTKYFGIIQIIVASLLRYNMAAFVGIVFVPVIIYTYKMNFKQYLYVAFMLMLVIGCKIIGQSYYNSSDWSTYVKYNHLRSGINDNPNSGVLYTSSFESISSNDVLMVLGTEQDPSITDSGVLLELNNKIKEDTKWSKFLKLYQLKFFVIPLLLLGVFSIAFFFFSNKSIRWIPIITFVILVLFLMYISINNYLKPRAVIPVLMAMNLIFAYCYDKQKINQKSSCVVLVMMCLGFSGMYLVESIRIGMNRNELFKKWNNQRTMILKHKNQVLWPSDLCEAGMSPMELKDNPINIVAAGWMLTYPKEQVLHNHMELLSKSIGIMLSKENNYDELIISHYITSLKEHYGITVKDSILEEDKDYRYYLLKEDL